MIDEPPHDGGPRPRLWGLGSESWPIWAIVAIIGTLVLLPLTIYFSQPPPTHPPGRWASCLLLGWPDAQADTDRDGYVDGEDPAPGNATVPPLAEPGNTTTETNATLFQTWCWEGSGPPWGAT